MSIIQKQIHINNKRRVLFLCTANSVCSQMAEAILRHKAGDVFDVYSAGIHSAKIDENTFIALKKFGLPTDKLITKSIDEFANQYFDYVITLCDEATQECRVHPWFAEQVYSGNSGQLMSWNFLAPKARSGISELDPFVQTLIELNNRITMFVSVETNKQLPNNVSTNKEIIENKDEKAIFSPIVFYKCLTDDLRLKTLMLTNYYGELCVCELMIALQEKSQPKVSRNLALLRKAKLLIDRRHGQWIFYRINPVLPPWIKIVLATTTECNIDYIRHSIDLIANMEGRPDKSKFCC